MTDVALGTLALAAGDVHAAHERFAAVGSAVDFRGAAVVAEFWFPDEVEARVAVGDVDEADRRLVEFERDAKRHNHPRSLAIALRCRALVDSDAARQMRRWPQSSPRCATTRRSTTRTSSAVRSLRSGRSNAGCS